MSISSGKRRAVVVVAALALVLVGALTLRPRQKGPASQTNQAAQPSAPPTDGTALRHDFMYPPGALKGSIEGRVLDNQGKPVVGAVVSVAPRLLGEVGFRDIRRKTPLALVRTDAQGRYRAENLAPGVLSIVASAAPFVPARRDPVTLEPNEQLTGIDLRLEGSGVRLHGTVSDSGGGGIAGARILAAGTASEGENEPSVFLVQGVADENGVFELYLQGQIPYDVTVSADGYADDQTWIYLKAETQHNVRLHPAARISGRVLDADQQPVVGAKVEVSLMDMYTWVPPAPIFTDEKGHYTSGGLDPGKYIVTARAGTKVSPDREPVSLALAEQLTVDLTLKAGLKVSGRVMNKAKQPIAGATVSFGTGIGVDPDDSSPKAKTNADGRYELSGLAGGSRVLTAQAPGYGYKDTLLPQMVENRKDFDFILGRSGRLLVTVTDEGGAPLSGVMGAVEVETGETPFTHSYRQSKTTSDKEGKLILDELPPGKMALNVFSQRGSRREEGLVLAEGEEKHLKVRLGGEVSVAGIVVYEDESPAAGITVVAFGKNGSNHNVTDKQGRFMIEKLSEGTFTVLIIDPEEQKVRLKRNPDTRGMAEVTLEAGERKRGVRLIKVRPRGSITGVVLDAKGQPVPGAQVGAMINVFARHNGCDDAFGAKILSEADGRFEIKNLPSGVFGICARHTGGAEAVVTDVPADTKDLKLVLKLPGSISGVVVDANGTPVSCEVLATFRQPEDANNELAPLDSSPAITHSDPSGAFILKGIRPGVWDVFATTKEKSRGIARHVVVEPSGNVSGVRIQITDGIRITGRLVNAETQAPLVGVRVHAPAARLVDSQTDAEGRFVIEGVPPGLRAAIHFDPGEQKLIADSLGAWVPTDAKSLDVGTFALTPGEEQPMKTRPSAGLRVSNEGGHATIVGIVQESAAPSSGIKLRDHILSIDGKAVSHLGQHSLERMLEGAEGQTVTVKVQPPNGEPRDVVIPLTKF